MSDCYRGVLVDLKDVVNKKIVFEEDKEYEVVSNSELIWNCNTLEVKSDGTVHFYFEQEISLANWDGAIGAKAYVKIYNEYFKKAFVQNKKVQYINNDVSFRNNSYSSAINVVWDGDVQDLFLNISNFEAGISSIVYRIEKKLLMEFF